MSNVNAGLTAVVVIIVGLAFLEKLEQDEPISLESLVNDTVDFGGDVWDEMRAGLRDVYKAEWK
jgi:hypothetical protein